MSSSHDPGVDEISVGWRVASKSGSQRKESGHPSGNQQLCRFSCMVALNCPCPMGSTHQPRAVSASRICLTSTSWGLCGRRSFQFDAALRAFLPGWPGELGLPADHNPGLAPSRLQFFASSRGRPARDRPGGAARAMTLSRDCPDSRGCPGVLPHLLASGLGQLAHLSSSSASALTIFLGDAPNSLAKR